MFKKIENVRLCSIDSIKLSHDKLEGNDKEFFFTGTSEKKLIEYQFNEGNL